ncbi:MAG: M15 family metallopeptidase [Bacteroidota bacterium]
MSLIKEAYPDQLIGIEEGEFIWCDSSRMAYDDPGDFDGFEDMLNRADLRAQMSQLYPMTFDSRLSPPPFSDPGRIRCEAFFRKMYGQHKAEVQAHLVAVPWLPSSENQTVMISSINQVHEKLLAISLELDSLPDSLKQFVRAPIGGTFNWRTIAGTDRLSMHSFGICIDIAVRHSHYWRWASNASDAPIPYHNSIPAEIVNIFEKHGFIWGGKWYHYDTMHFEYRPELLRRGKLSSKRAP